MGRVWLTIGGISYEEDFKIIFRVQEWMEEVTSIEYGYGLNYVPPKNYVGLIWK